MTPISTEQRRIVPGQLWLYGKEQQEREWTALEEDFWKFLRAHGCNAAIDIRKWKEVDEERGWVILHIETKMFGTIDPENISYLS